MSSGRFFVSLLLLLLFADKEERMKHIPQKTEIISTFIKNLLSLRRKTLLKG
jgi:hypothetical protein